MIQRCTIVGCERTPDGSRGMCERHYAQKMRTGKEPSMKRNHQSPKEPRRGFVRDGIGYVPLPNGKVFMIDPDDLDLVCQYNWHEKPGRNTSYVQGAAGNGNRKIKLHRWLLNAPPDKDVDHVNGDGFDNRRGNLRLVTQSQNNANRRKGAGCSSKYKGVCYSRGGWVAHIKYRGGFRNLGRHKSEEDAAIVYDVAAQLCFGEYARLNFPGFEGPDTTDYGEAYPGNCLRKGTGTGAPCVVCPSPLSR